MRRLFSILFFSFIGFCTTAQMWQPLGGDNRDEIGFGFNNLLWIDHQNDTLYSALSVQNPKSLGIKKFDGYKWVSFCPTFAIGSNSSISRITMDKLQIPYVVYEKPTVGFTVENCINGIWNKVGNAPIASGAITDAIVKFDKTNIPHVAIIEVGKISVFKFNGTIWDSLGNKNFTNVTGAIDMNFDTSGVPYIVFSDPVNLNRATVMKYNGSSWITISPFGGLSTLAGGDYDIKFDTAQNILYLKYYDAALGATVKKYDGSTWSQVGIQFANSIADELYVNSIGTPYINLRIGDSIRVMKYDGMAWGQVGITLKNNSGISMFTMLHDTIPVIGQHYSKYGGKPLVSQYDGTNWKKIGTYGFAEEGVPKFTNGSTANTNRMLVTTNSNNIPYTVFSDQQYNSRLSFKHYANNTWSYIGTPGFTDSISYPIQIERGENDTMYLLYAQTGTAGYKFGYFDGTNFTVINSGLSNNSYPVGTTFDLDSSGVPYVIYPDPSNFNITTLKKWNNASWNVISTVPATAAVQMKINSQNEVYVLYNSTVNNVTTSNLIKSIGNTWTPIAQLPLQALMKIAPNDLVYFTTLSLSSWLVPGTVNPFIAYSYIRNLYQITGFSWALSSVLYTTPVVINGVPPPPSESYLNIVFDTSSIPYVAIRTYDSAYILGITNGVQKITSSSAGWHPQIRTANFDLTVSDNNTLTVVYATGTAYALSVPLGNVPDPPQVVSPVQYCVGDTASPLVAIGQNLLWLGPNSNSNPPTPATNTPDTLNWAVRQNTGIYTSAASNITVFVHPKPTLSTSSDTICLGDTSFLSTPQISGATYTWKRTETINGVTTVQSFDSTSTIPITDSGSYSVVTSVNGCESDVISITVLPKVYPTISLTGPSSTPVGQIITVLSTVSNASSGYSIYWYVNGIFYTITPADFTYTKNSGSDTIIAVVQPDLGSPCMIPDTAIFIIDEAVNSVNGQDKVNVSIYPNPFSNSITITNMEHGDQVLLYSIEGRIVKQYQGTGENVQSFDTKNIVAGSYFIKIVRKGNTIQIPMIKL